MTRVFGTTRLLEGSNLTKGRSLVPKNRGFFGRGFSLRVESGARLTGERIAVNKCDAKAASEAFFVEVEDNAVALTYPTDGLLEEPHVDLVRGGRL